MWIKLDDGFATHPKVLRAGPFGLVAQVRALCYASQNKTDGFIPAEAIVFITIGIEPSITDTMVRCGLWDSVEGGYQIHDYLHWNMSREQYESMKESLSKAGKKGMKSRWKSKKKVDNQGYNQPYNHSITEVNNLPITSLSTATDTLSSLNSPNPKKEKRIREKRVLRSISDDDKPTEKHFELGRHLGVNVGPEWGKFKNYCLAHDKRYADFEAAFRNWIANVPTLQQRRSV